jgi:hypothetical protein
MPNITHAPREYRPKLPAKPWWRDRREWKAWAVDVAVIATITNVVGIMALVIGNGEFLLPFVVIVLTMVLSTDAMRKRRALIANKRRQLACQRFQEWLSKAEPIN